MTCGWAGRFAAFRAGGEVAAQAMDDFRADAQAFERLEQCEPKTNAMASFYQRSCSRLLVVQQFLAGFVELGWGDDGDVPADVQKISAEHNGGFLATQIVENENVMMKNHRVLKQAKINTTGPRRVM